MTNARHGTRVLITLTVAAALLAAPAMAGLGGATVASDARSQASWSVPISANSSFGTGTVVIGAAASATESLDSSWDSPQTPAPPGTHLSLYEVDENASGDFRRLNVSYVEQSDHMVWELALDYQTAADSAGDVTLEWAPDTLDAIPAADETQHDVTLVVDDREVDMRTTSTATVELADASGTKSLRIVADATTGEDPGDDPGEDPGGSDPGGDDPGGDDPDGAPPSDQPAATTTPNPTTTTPPTTTADTTTQTPATTTTANPTTPETTTRTPTATSTESPPTTEPDSQPNETGTNIPGFTVPTAVIAMLSAALLALRRD